MKQEKNILKMYFETGDKPTQVQYENLIDSLRHAYDKIPIEDLEEEVVSQTEFQELANNVTRSNVDNHFSASQTFNEEVNANGNISLPDSTYLYLGNNNDIRIFHSGTDSQLDNFDGNFSLRNRDNNAITHFYNADSGGTQVNVLNLSHDGIQMNTDLQFGDGEDRKIIGPTNEDLILIAKPNSLSEGIKLSVDNEASYALQIFKDNYITTKGEVTLDNGGVAGRTVIQNFYSSPTDSTNSVRSARFESGFTGADNTDSYLKIQNATTGNTLVDAVTFNQGNTDFHGEVEMNSSLTVGSNGVFSGNITLNNSGGNRWVLTEETNTGTGTLRMQAGQGSAAFGGSIIAYAHSHATNPGWIKANISSGSGGKFAVNTSGTGDATNVFTVDSSGNSVQTGTATATDGTDFARLVHYGVEFGRGSNYLKPITNGDKILYIGGSAQNSTDWNAVRIWTDNGLFHNGELVASQTWVTSQIQTIDTLQEVTDNGATTTNALTINKNSGQTGLILKTDDSAGGNNAPFLKFENTTYNQSVRISTLGDLQIYNTGLSSNIASLSQSGDLSIGGSPLGNRKITFTETASRSGFVRMDSLTAQASGFEISKEGTLKAQIYVEPSSNNLTFYVNSANRFRMGSSGIFDWGASAGTYGYLSWDTNEAILGSRANKNVAIRPDGTGIMTVHSDLTVSEATYLNAGLEVLVTDAERTVKFKAPNSEERFNFYVGGTGNDAHMQIYQANGSTIGAQIHSIGQSYLTGDFAIGTTSSNSDISGSSTNFEVSNANVAVINLDATAGHRWNLYASASNNFAIRDDDAGLVRYEIDGSGNHDFGSGTASFAGDVSIIKANAGLIIQETGQEQWKILGAGSGLFIQRDGTNHFVLDQNGAIGLYNSGGSSRVFEVNAAGSITTEGSFSIESSNPSILLEESGVTDQNIDIQLNGGQFKIIGVNDARSTFNEWITVGASNGATVFNGEGVNIVGGASFGNSVTVSGDVTATNFSGNINGISSSLFTRHDTTNTFNASQYFNGNISLNDTDNTYSHELYFTNDTYAMGIDYSNTKALRFIDRESGVNIVRAEMNMANGNMQFDGAVTSSGIITGSITSTGNNHLYLSPSGSGRIYLGSAGNGNIIHHYSDANDGEYATFDHSGSIYTISNSGGNIEVNGKLFMPSNSVVRGSGTGTANTSYLGFYESDGTTRQGYIGFGSSGNSRLYIYNDTTSKYLDLREDGNLYYDGNEVLDRGNHVAGTDYVSLAATNTFLEDTTFNKSIVVGGLVDNSVFPSPPALAEAFKIEYNSTSEEVEVSAEAFGVIELKDETKTALSIAQLDSADDKVLVSKEWVENKETGYTGTYTQSDGYQFTYSNGRLTSRVFVA